MTNGTPSIGELKKVDITDAWKGGELEFTRWLAGKGLERLSEVLGLDLEAQELERRVRDIPQQSQNDLKIDLVCTDNNSGDTVVIENQITSADHDHLGKMLTYAAWEGAKTIVWIAPEFRYAYIEALRWLNELGGVEANFLAVTVEVLSIDDSARAPKFTVVAHPDGWFKKKPVGLLYSRYWNGYHATLRKFADAAIVSKGRPSGADMAFGVLAAGFKMNVKLGTKDLNDQKRPISVEIFRSGPEAKWLFSQLRREQTTIDAEMEDKVEWQEGTPQGKNDDSGEKLSRRIVVYRDGKTIEDHDDWEHQHQWIIDKVNAFVRVFKGRLSELNARMPDQLDDDTSDVAPPVTANPPAPPVSGGSSGTPGNANTTPPAATIDWRSTASTPTPATPSTDSDNSKGSGDDAPKGGLGVS